MPGTPPDIARQRRIGLITFAAGIVVYSVLIAVSKWWAPSFRDPLRAAVLVTLFAPMVLGLLSMPLTRRSDRARRLAAPVYASGVGLTVASLFALPFLIDAKGIVE